jgi:DNA-binding protein YbaB
MFDELKKVQELKRMQGIFKQERETVEKRGVSVTVNGAMELESVTLNPLLDRSETELGLVQCVNEATRNIQKRLAKIMMSSGLGGF